MSARRGFSRASMDVRACVQTSDDPVRSVFRKRNASFSAYSRTGSILMFVISISANYTDLLLILQAP